MIDHYLGQWGFIYIYVSLCVILSNMLLNVIRGILSPYIKRKREDRSIRLSLDFCPVEPLTESSDWIPLHERKKQKALERKQAKERMEKLHVPVHRVING